MCSVKSLARSRTTRRLPPASTSALSTNSVPAKWMGCVVNSPRVSVGVDYLGGEPAPMAHVARDGQLEQLRHVVPLDDLHGLAPIGCR